MMVETCADIAGHIASDRNMRPPTSYADTFTVLSENRIIDAELSAIMGKMAKFRNIVVHQYEQVDAEIVMLILKKHLTDVEWDFITLRHCNFVCERGRPHQQEQRRCAA
jgi:uncharacterized protein YutE (UPF0331/DUF86 family)